MKARIFLSYARKDGAEVCDFFQTALQLVGYDVWRDIDNMPGGEPWRAKIEDTIGVVDVVLLFLTHGAVASPNVRDEWETAIRFQKRIVPLVVDNVQVPMELRVYAYRLIQDPKTREIEPAVLQRDLVSERNQLKMRFAHLTAGLGAIADAAKRQYLDPIVDHLRMALDAEPVALPPEVLRMLFSLLDRLKMELIARNDITSLVDSVAAGTYTASNWAEESVYKLRIAETSQIFRKVRDAIPTTPVHVVVVAMTAVEASELESGKAFDGLPAEWEHHFKSLKLTLPAEWLKRYGASAEEWRPFDNQSDIAALIQSEFRLMSQNASSPFRYSYVDIRDLARPERRKRLNLLRASGCLVVIDAISSWHPRLHAAYRSTSLDVSPTSLIVRVRPHKDLAWTQLGFLLREWLSCDFFRRYDDDRDLKCETADELLKFQRWLNNQLGATTAGVSAPQGNMRNYMNNFSG